MPYKIQVNDGGKWVDTDWKDNGKPLRFQVPQLAEDEIRRMVLAYNSATDYSHKWTTDQFRVVPCKE